MTNKLFVFLVILSSLFLYLPFSVSAVSGARCEGNVLVYFDNSNTVVRQDCSILHAGNGNVFRGICQLYTGGADCWRTEGAVTPTYRDTVRGFSYNSSSDPWGPAYNPSTTTTLPASTSIISPAPVQCPTCPTCVFCEDCSKYKSLVTTLNYSNINNKKNADAYRAESLAKIDKAVYSSALADKDKMISSASAATDACVKEKANVESLNNTYMMVAGVSVMIMIVVVIIWVKYEFRGGVGVDDIYADSKPKRKGWFRRSD